MERIWLSQERCLRLFEGSVILAKLIESEWVGIRNDDKLVWILSWDVLSRAAFGGKGSAHDGSEGWVLDLDDRRKSWILHDPEDGVGWLFEFELSVWSGEDGLNGTAVAIGDIFGDRDDLAIGIDGGADVLDE